MSLKSKLNRLKGHLQLENKSMDKNEEATTKDAIFSKEESSSDKQLEDKWASLGFVPYYFEDQVSFVKRTIYPFHQRNEFNKIYDWWKSSHLPHPLSCKDVPLERMMFFDTETTGLSTGAGNSIFLIGYARIVEGGIEVTQHMLSDPSSEAAFMYHFLQDFTEDDYLVSYNGKAFDWPQVKSRHAFVRNVVPKLPAFGHIDLLHAARRLWKHELPSCRLSIVEKEKLSVFREHDTPGSMAPLLYFDYIHHKDPKELAGIIEHNDQDVRSLVTLFIEISSRLSYTNDFKLSAKEHIQIGNWFNQLKWTENAFFHYEKAIDSSDKDRDEAYYKLGLMWKKCGNLEKAKTHFLQALSIQSIPNVDSFIELAKIAEHGEKNVGEAYRYSKLALEQIKKSVRLTSKETALKLKVEKRIERLANKLDFH
ncbi:ribonuclease H-like domain-containing protein [Evansella sp. AB-rgal1]|uniref:ribonuclease H-like domain-containing protein n=1 Tax=Evansella sp. AB-rgal1 TaxID=3242696 RepID=UPI00359EE62D